MQDQKSNRGENLNINSLFDLKVNYSIYVFVTTFTSSSWFVLVLDNLNHATAGEKDFATKCKLIYSGLNFTAATEVD